ncbi:ATP-binding protein [Endozoicomonas sp. G2_1]|uniref:ATP-binding protein n=1 Tax=Endozoicomonas sp. G2_1 TaxID=2821091 RepID=UPI001ADA6D8D|nr:ATP-binding protein [Endozoicomonas sp. G2_1]MBO9492121.1 ATP-binding protein [Endozoicomonas sp. G2_1]
MSKYSMDSVVVNSLSKPPIIVLHGDAGVGKTTFAAQAQDAIFIIAEDGLGMLPVAHMPEPESAQDVLGQLQAIKNDPRDRKWLVVDSVTALEKKIWSELCDTNNADSIEEVGGGYGKGYTRALEWMDRFVRELKELRAQTNMGVILIAHTKTQTISPPDKAAYDQYVLNINNKIGDYIHTQADIVAYCELEQIIKQTDQGFGRQQGTAIETGKRVLHCYSSKKYTSKNRYGIQQPIPMDFNQLMTTIASNAPKQGN